MTPLQLRTFIHHGGLAAGFGKLQQQILADVGVRAISRPRNRTVILHRLPSARNFCALRSFTLKSLTSMLGTSGSP